MKLPKFYKNEEFNPPKGLGWMKKFRDDNYFKTKTGKIIYRVVYRSGRGLYSRQSAGYVVLSPINGDTWRQYTVTEENESKYIPATST